jgi:protein-S-isoprenylcysteine O-methyltransferase Ste14
MRWVGVILNGLGGALRIYPVFVFGRRFSGLVAIQPGHTLTDDIYGIIRHRARLDPDENTLALWRFGC